MIPIKLRFWGSYAHKSKEEKEKLDVPEGGGKVFNIDIELPAVPRVGDNLCFSEELLTKYGDHVDCQPMTVWSVAYTTNENEVFICVNQGHIPRYLLEPYPKNILACSNDVPDPTD